MSRSLGDEKRGQNFEILATSPIDARQITPTKASLTALTGKYNGMICAVNNDGANNGLYICSQNQGVAASDWTAVGSSITIDTTLDSTSTNPLTNAEIDNQLGLKQNTLTFNAPSSDNTNPSTSAQIKAALDVKLTTPTLTTGGEVEFQNIKVSEGVRAHFPNNTGAVAEFTFSGLYGCDSQNMIIQSKSNGSTVDGVSVQNEGIFFKNKNGNNPVDDTMCILMTGDVGIGTTTPDEKLHIEGGNIKIKGTHTVTINSDEILKSGNSSYTLGTFNNQSLIFKTSNATRMTINGSGNMGFGETSPLTRFQIGEMTNYGSFAWDSDAAIVSCETKTSNSALNDPETALYLTRQGTSGLSYGAMAAFKLSRYENSGTSSRTRFDINLAHSSFDDINVLTALSSGNIGIGTNAPTEKLHIDGGNLKAQLAKIGNLDFGSVGNPALYAGFAYDTNFTITEYAFLQGSGGETFVNAKTGKFVAFRIQNSDKMRLLSNGNFGIGNNDPQYTLDVTGDINFTGNLTQNGSAFSSGGSLTVDSAMSTTSTNPVQNSTIQTALNTKLNLTGGTLTGNLQFGNVTTYGISSIQRAIYFHNTSTNYGIYRSAGAWDSPNYPYLIIKFITGLVLDGGTNASYNNAYVKVIGKMGVNVTSKPTSQFEVNGTAEATKLIVNSNDSDAIKIQHPTLSADFLTISSATIRCDGGTTSGKNMKIINSIDTDMEFRVGQFERMAIKISGSDDSVEICSDTTGDVKICEGGGDILIGSSGTNLETELNKLSSSTGLGDCLSSSYLSLSTNSQNLFDGIEDYTWSGSGDGTSITDGGSTTMDFVALKKGFYSIDVFLRCSNGTVNERVRVYGYVLISNSSGTEISRGYLGESYYRDDNNAYDDCIIAGSVCKFLNVGDKWRVRTQRTDRQNTSGFLTPDQSTSKLYCQYMGIGIAQ